MKELEVRYDNNPLYEYVHCKRGCKNLSKCTHQSFSCKFCSEIKTHHAKIINVHLKEVHSTSFCVKCNEEVKEIKEGDIENHKREHYSKDEHKCIVCPRTFKLPSRLRKHLKIHEIKERRDCNLCKMSIEEKKLSDHLMKCVFNNASSMKYPCTFRNCTKEFRSNKGATLHEKKRHNKGSSKWIWEKGNAEKRSVEVKDTVEVIRCYGEKQNKINCYKTFKEMSTLRAHIAKEHDSNTIIYSCKDCSKSYYSNEHHKCNPIVSSTCGYFRDAKKFYIHKGEHKECALKDPDNKPKNLESNHNVRSTNAFDDVWISTKDGSNVNVTCSDSSKEFQALSMYDLCSYDKMKSGHEENCQKCRTNRKNYSEKKEQLKIVYPNWDEDSCLPPNGKIINKISTKFQCEICGNSLSSKDSLERHNSTVHNDKEFQCFVCDSIFKKKSQINKHFKTCQNPNKYFLTNIRPREYKRKEKPFECNQCGKHFNRKYNLGKHIELLHVNKKKPFTCPYVQCNLTFGKKLEVKTHQYYDHVCKKCCKILKSDEESSRHVCSHQNSVDH